MTRIKDLHKKWMKDPEYRKEYDALEEEFALALAVAKARARVGLSQAQLAKRMRTTQSTVARLESGRGLPSTRTLDRFAKAVARWPEVLECQHQFPDIARVEGGASRPGLGCFVERNGIVQRNQRARAGMLLDVYEVL